MEKRTISQRNLLGAFVGGMLGILALGYFNNGFLLFIGVFAGVIGGWWYQEIWNHTVKGYNDSVARTCAFGAFLFTPVHRLGEWRKTVVEIDFPLLPTLAFLATPFIWLLRRPVAITLWARSHPV